MRQEMPGFTVARFHELETNMAYQFIVGRTDVPSDSERDAGIKSVRLTQVAVTVGGVQKWELFRVPDTMTTDADISDWIEKQAAAREVEMSATVKTSALKV